MDKNEMSDTTLVKKYIDSVNGMAHQSAIEIIINLEKKLETAYERGFVDGVKKNSESRVTKFMDKEWVGLTDDEINKYFLDNWARYYSYHGCFRELMRWQEERLKEKNGG